jgi:hypothetical protein
MFVIYGKQSTVKGGEEVFLYQCPFCEKVGTTSLYLQSWYYHIFWIPFLPFEKQGKSLCSECGAKRTELQFGPKLLEEYRIIKHKFKHPWWTYTITILLLLLIISIIIAVL